MPSIAHRDHQQRHDGEPRRPRHRPQCEADVRKKSGHDRRLDSGQAATVAWVPHLTRPKSEIILPPVSLTLRRLLSGLLDRRDVPAIAFARSDLAHGPAVASLD